MYIMLQIHGRYASIIVPTVVSFDSPLPCCHSGCTYAWLQCIRTKGVYRAQFRVGQYVENENKNVIYKRSNMDFVRYWESYSSGYTQIVQYIKKFYETNQSVSHGTIAVYSQYYYSQQYKSGIHEFQKFKHLQFILFDPQLLILSPLCNRPRQQQI